jgi:Skp family chaperone for outer membrane proteins
MKTMATLAAGIVLGTAGFLGAAAPCTPVAFVNINQVFKAYPRANKLVQDLNAEAEKSKADFTAREQDLRKAAQDLEVKFDQGTPEYEQGRRKIELMLSEIQYDKKATVDVIVRKQVRGMGLVYKEVCAEAERIATAKGYSSVVNIDTDPITVEEKGQVIGVNELKLQMALRTAIWADPAHDITKDVIEALEKAK